MTKNDYFCNATAASYCCCVCGFYSPMNVIAIMPVLLFFIRQLITYGDTLQWKQWPFFFFIQLSCSGWLQHLWRDVMFIYEKYLLSMDQWIMVMLVSNGWPGIGTIRIRTCMHEDHTCRINGSCKHKIERVREREREVAEARRRGGT